MRQRADGRYEGIVDLGWSDGARRRKSVYAKTKTELRQKMRAVERARDNHLPLPDERIRVSEFLEL